MDKSVTINNVLVQIKQLDYDSKLSIMEKLVLLLKRYNKSYKTIHLTELNKLGCEIWKNVDIDEYVKNERQWN